MLFIRGILFIQCKRELQETINFVYLNLISFKYMCNKSKVYFFEILNSANGKENSENLVKWNFIKVWDKHVNKRKKHNCCY